MISVTCVKIMQGDAEMAVKMVKNIFFRAGLTIPDIKPGWSRIINGKRKQDAKVL